MMDADSAIRSLARQINTLRREIRAQARASQGAHRSVDVGVGGTTYYTDDGVPVLAITTGDDGEFGLIAVDPSTPPVPTEPDLISIIEGIKIIWDGTFEVSNWTSSMSHVEVHVSATPDFEATDATQVTAFTSQNGGEFVYSTPGDTDPRWVAFVAVSVSQVESAKSVEVSAAGLPLGVAEVVAAVDELTAQVLDNTEQIGNTSSDLENTAETAFEANDKATTADGRISISDYEPATDDAVGRNNGSLWFTRTRARVNYITNPSFEIDTTNWSPVAASMGRVLDSSPIDGEYVLEITNDATSAHFVQYFDAVALSPATEGQTWTASTYAKLVSGTGLGCYIEIVYLDVAYGLTGFTDGAPQDLVVGDWKRLEVVAIAPANTAIMLVRVISLNPSDVWRIDGSIAETSEDLGRYFDGTSYDATWDGTPHNSASTMTGGQIVKIFELNDNTWVPKYIMGDVLKDIDGASITSGYMDGERIQDNSIPIDKISGTPVLASEDISAGELINVYSVDGQFEMRLACAADGREAHGFVLADVATGAIGHYFDYGYNPFAAGMSPGVQFLSVTPGGITNVIPQTVGHMVQKVGVASNTTVMNFRANNPIYIT